MRYRFFIIICMLLCSCSFAPTYHRPMMTIASHYKEEGPWQKAQPNHASLDKGPWWKMYDDPILNRLEQELLLCNQDIKAAIARFDQARALLIVAKSYYIPRIDGVANATRQKVSTTVANALPSRYVTDLIAAVNLNYELDVWGKIRNSVAAAKSDALASSADLAMMNLSLQAELAIIYFSLRGADKSQIILNQTVDAYKKALYLTKKRHEGGAVTIMDVDEAINQLEVAKALAADMRLQRAQYEHAIAVLIGKPATSFNLKKKAGQGKIVAVSANIPSILLERRPDIAEAEYKVQSANSHIGVTRAAYFPDFNIATAIGYQSHAFNKLFEPKSLIWSLGPTVASALLNTGSKPEVTQTLIDGWRISGLNQQSWAIYNETVAIYRQTVLNAFREVEDSLIAIKELNQEYHSQTRARYAAEDALRHAFYRYKGGLITYLDVVVLQKIALQAELDETNTYTRYQIASIKLIKALGGGWSQDALNKCKNS